MPHGVFEHGVKKRFTRLVKGAAERGLSVTFSQEQYAALVIDARCHYCGAEALSSYVSTGLDRIDNSKGYELSLIHI